MSARLAIVLSGGRAKDAFQVGVLDVLVNTHGVKPAIAVGTSTGAIQAPGVAQDDIAGLLRVWTGIKGSGDIYRDRGGVAGTILTGQKALYDTALLAAAAARSAAGALSLCAGPRHRVGGGVFRHVGVRPGQDCTCD